MKIVADCLVRLPFELDYCAKGPNVDPIELEFEGWNAVLYFPPSMSDGTDGKGIFHEWAWWTGTTLRVVMEQNVDAFSEFEAYRQPVASSMSSLLRLFLNNYRIKFDRPDIFPVRVSVNAIKLFLEDDNGARQELPEPSDGYFFSNMPKEPPLGNSVNESNLEEILTAIASGHCGTQQQHLQLDIERLRSQGESDRAAQLEVLEQTL